MNGSSARPRSWLTLATVIAILLPLFGAPPKPARAFMCVPTNVATISVGVRPKAIAVDPATLRAFVALFDTSSVAVIDTTRNQLVAIWGTDQSGNANGIAFANGRVLVSKRNNVRLAMLDATNGNFLGNVTVGRLPYGVGALGNRAWVANFQDNSVSTIDTTTNRVLATQNVGVYPSLVAPLDDRAYVSFWGGGLAMIGADGTVRGKIPLDAGTFGVAADALNKRIYAANRGTNRISLIDATTNTVIQSVVEAETPFAIAVNPATNHLFVVLAQNNRVRVRDATTFAIIADVPVGAQGNDGGDGIAVVNNQVYVSNYDAGTVSVISDACVAPPTATPPPSPTLPAPSVTPTSGTPSSIQVSNGLAVLNAYPYEQFQTDAYDATHNFPYKKFDLTTYSREPRSPIYKTFRTIVIENEYLRLTFLPDVGGRLWQVLYKPTNQTVFYTNRWLKPTNWGPPQQLGWLGVGGMEWALPVDEHGYAWGVPWAYTIERGVDQATITFSDSKSNMRVRAQVAVTLPAHAAYFVVHPRIENPTSAATRVQFWINAQIALNEKNVSTQTEFYLPAHQVFVHSTGDETIPAQYVPPATATLPVTPMPWPVVSNRNLANYSAWKNYLGVFAVTPSANFAGAYNHANDLGIARVFPPERAPGVKLFAWGANSPLRRNWTDDESDYFELWGGLPRTFFRDDNVTLGAGEVREWDECWVPFVRTGGLSAASRRAILGLTLANNRATVGASVALPGTRGALVLTRDGVELRRWIVALDPGNTFREQFDVPTGGTYHLRFVAEDGSVIAETR